MDCILISGLLRCSGMFVTI